MTKKNEMTREKECRDKERLLRLQNVALGVMHAKEKSAMTGKYGDKKEIKKALATTYSPAQFPMKYHRPKRA